MTRMNVFFTMTGVLLLLLSLVLFNALSTKDTNTTYATTLTGIPYSGDSLFLRFGGLNGYFSGHYAYPGAYSMQNESFVYSIREINR